MRRLTIMLLLVPSFAAADAAVKAREGEINHWIEYYQRDRQPQLLRAAPQDTGRPSPVRAESGAAEKDAKR